MSDTPRARQNVAAQMSSLWAKRCATARMPSNSTRWKLWCPGKAISPLREPLSRLAWLAAALPQRSITTLSWQPQSGSSEEFRFRARAARELILSARHWRQGGAADKPSINPKRAARVGQDGLANG